MPTTPAAPAPRIVLAGGGTGGHVYPSLGVAEALRTEAPAVSLRYIGRAGGAEEALARAASLPFSAVRAAGVRGKSPVAMARGALALAFGTLQAWRALRAFRPDAVFATGGYASVPVVVAAWARRAPALVYLPDVHPGWAVRLLASLARRVACSTEAALPHLPAGKAVVTGYPVRPDFFALTRETARPRLGLPPRVPVVLVSGGSSGSRDLNRAVARHLPQLLQLAHLIHTCGPADAAELRSLAERLPDELRAKYHLYPYLDDMAAAMASADVAVLRAGASALGELPAVGLPAVLVPGPFSDQARNAAYLAERGAAVVLPNEQLDRLLPTVQGLLTDIRRLTAMRRAMTALARPTAAVDLARLLLAVAR